MNPTPYGLALLLCLPLTAVQGQTLVAPSLQESQADDEEKVAIKRIKVSPAAEPDPALRYRFWPAPEHRTSDSPTLFVNRAILLSLQATNDKASRSEFAEKYDEWSEMPLDELPPEKVQAFLNKFGTTALSEIARGENYMRIEYDLHLNELSAAEMVQTLLPELQEMRQLARLLNLRIRLAVAQERWDDAVDDIRLGFRLAEVAGHTTEFLIGRLVGFAISGMMFDATLEAISRPGCPNLYWALASLPENRLFETRDSIEFESVLVSRLMAKSGALPDYPIGREAARMRIKALADQATVTLAFGNDDGTNEFDAQMLSGLYVVAMADESRQMLATTTAWGERAWELSAPEAVLRAAYLKFARARDGWLKWSLLPSDVWADNQDRWLEMVKTGGDSRDVLQTLVMTLTPAVDAARRAGQRTLQTRNLLISIEAIRMYAASHGELPRNLDQLKPVPCWSDGITRRPFGYARTSATTATLTRHERWPGDPETTFQIEMTEGQ